LNKKGSAEDEFEANAKTASRLKVFLTCSDKKRGVKEVEKKRDPQWGGGNNKAQTEAGACRNAGGKIKGGEFPLEKLQFGTEIKK